jgi:integrase
MIRAISQFPACAGITSARSAIVILARGQPRAEPRRLKTDGDGYRPWSEDEIFQFMERGSTEWHFNALFALLSAQRGQDQVALRWKDYDGQQLYVVQQKGRRQVKLWIEAHPLLKDALDRRRAAIAET